jgi:hypothetical protein
MMSERVSQLLQQLSVSDSNVAQAQRTTETVTADWLDTATAEELQFFWLGVEQLHDTDQLATARFDRLLGQLQTQTPPNPPGLDTIGLIRVIEKLYRTWRDDSVSRHRLPIFLLQRTGAEGWRAFAELMATDPPSDDSSAVEAFLPLWKTAPGPFDVLFPRLLDAMQHPSVAAIVLDLANYLARQGRLPEHPAAVRATELTWLLGQLVDRLEGFEQTSREEGVRDLQVAQHVQETITLAIALCDTLSLLQRREATGKWYRILDLQHRRLRVEAAAALARLGEPAGVQALSELAAQPLVRLRVHAYAAELGILDQMPAKWRSSEALAESEMVIRLAEPDLFGLAPSSCELWDQRQLAWPGYDEPRACYLFRYVYHLTSSDYVNVALAGPVAHALMADLTDLSADDVYAVYAGWNADHRELRQVEMDATNQAEATEIARRSEVLRESGYGSIKPQFWGQFFGVRLLVATAERQSQRGTVVQFEQYADWFPEGNPIRPLRADLAYCMFVGRQLLSHFNDDYPAGPRPREQDEQDDPA